MQNKKNTSPYPQWVLNCRKPKTEVRFINGKYYLYSCSSKYDPQTKKSKKISGSILGSITEKDGFIESDKKKQIREAKQLVDFTITSIREYAFTEFLNNNCSDIKQKLELFFPMYSKLIEYMAYSRFIHCSPIKNMPMFTAKSMLSVADTKKYSDKDFALALRDIGRNREKIMEYLKSFVKPNDHLLFDVTNMFSASRKMRYAKLGYNQDMVYGTQFNLMYVYDATLRIPVFYKLFPGNIRDVRGFKNCLKEANLNNSTIIIDKGFYSKENIQMLQDEQLQFIIPLQRSNATIDYDAFEETINQNFKHTDRYIWYQSKREGNLRTLLFKDKALLVHEEKDYLDRIQSIPEKYTLEGYLKKKKTFGTITLLTNKLEVPAQQIFEEYKSRNEIEILFDAKKNELEADKPYMQNEEALEGWMFINHIALQWYYIIYNTLKEANLLSKFSVKDVGVLFNESKAARVNGEWIKEPVVKKLYKYYNLFNVSIP